MSKRRPEYISEHYSRARQILTSVEATEWHERGSSWLRKSSEGKVFVGRDGVVVICPPDVDWATKIKKEAKP